ncbi:MAG TPA: hypothetical protein VGN72_24210 [Tepidisphaeraceae bacterium]|jgi:hypothetical protein|nr:hypothetical protein [Tepidisphaeraceae bacterium]
MSVLPCFTAFVRFGDNGSSTNHPVSEYGINDAQGIPAVTGQCVWDASPSDGIDSGWVSVQLVASVGSSGGAVGWTVIGGVTVPVSTSAIGFGAIDEVEFTAHSMSGGTRMAMSELRVEFFVGGVLKQAVDIAAEQCPDADTLGQSNVTAEDSVSATPSRDDIDKVVVTGRVLLQADANVTPAANNIRGELRIYTSSCNP